MRNQTRYIQKTGESMPLKGYETVIGDTLLIKGTVTSSGSARIDGIIEGPVNITEDLLVGPPGKITGNINCGKAEIAGIVIGDISAGKVHLMATAKIQGSIYAEDFSAETGASIDGAIKIKAKDSGQDDKH